MSSNIENIHLVNANSEGGTLSPLSISYRNYSNLLCLFAIQYLIFNNPLLFIHFHACPNYFRFLSRHAVNIFAIKSEKKRTSYDGNYGGCGFWQMFRYIDVQSVVAFTLLTRRDNQCVIVSLYLFVCMYVCVCTYM